MENSLIGIYSYKLTKLLFSMRLNIIINDAKTY
jgi:hypothetical protein